MMAIIWQVCALSTLCCVAGFEAVPCNATTIDCGLDFFREVYERFSTVEHEVVVMPFFIKPQLKLFSSVAGQAPDTTLEDLIVRAVRRGVHVWILGWDNAASEKFLPFHQDTVYEGLFKASGEDHEHLHLMLDTSRNFISSVYYLPHIKSYVFDRKIAYVGGLDFAENRLDTPQHVRPDFRLVHVPVDASHVTGNEKPWQDAMVKIDGPAAEHVAMVLIERWWTYCKSEGYLRSQATRPLDAVADAIWGVEKSFSPSRWKSYQCSKLPEAGSLGMISLSIRKGPEKGEHHRYRVKVHPPQLQSVGLPVAHPQEIDLLGGMATQQFNILGLRALDQKLPESLEFTVLGKTVQASRDREVAVELKDGDTLLAQWLPNGVGPATSRGATCKVVLSGDRDWMGVESPLTENYDEHIQMIRDSKHFIFIENQYFSTDFPSISHECMHGNVRGEAVLYSGATNRIGEVLLDRIKRAGRLGEQFSVAVIIPLGTEPGSFYPNLRGSYCFEQAVEDFWKTEKLQSNWRDYFSFFFLANAVHAPDDMGGPGTAFYGIFTHTKAIVVDDEVALIGSANINDRSLNGDRDAEVGVKITGGHYPRHLREKLLEGHLLNLSLCNRSRFVGSLNDVATANAAELYRATGIKFPEGTFTKDDHTEHFLGLKGLMNVPLVDANNEMATLQYPDSRVVAGGGGLDTFQWFVVRGDAPPPNLHGVIFPWSRNIWGLPKMTQVTQILSNEFNWRRLFGDWSQKGMEAPLAKNIDRVNST